MSLTLATWNVWNRSPAPGRIAELQADICAFQELTEAHIAHLDGHYLAEDFIEGEVTRLGLVTRLPVRRHEVIGINLNREISASPLGRAMGWVECLEAQHLVVEAGGPLSVVNLHLSCAVGPGARADEISRILAGFELSERAVILGDFNSFAQPLLAPVLAPLCAYRWGDFAKLEERALRRRMASLGFAACPLARPTLPRFGLRLDQIFCRGLRILEVEVGRETMGSDHRPVRATLS
ncbi:MAG: endonuclease/exonuclease/phosphatase family protein, partial [Pseudomonadota bacterium]